MKVHICREINLNSFRDFESFSGAVLDGQVRLSQVGRYCYFFGLVGAQTIAKELIPITLEASLHFSDQHTSRQGATLAVSVTSREPNHKEWIEHAEFYPGATVTKLERRGYTAY